MNTGMLVTPLAIVGMGCRLPGADGLDAYWELLRRGENAIGELPPDRLNRELYFDPRKGVRGKTYSTLGGLIPARPLDHSICALPEKLERSSDPCHRILCEVAASACRHAGYDPFDLPSRNVGVYVGHSGGSTLASDLARGTCAEHSADQLRQLEAFRELPTAEQEAVIAELVARIRREQPRRGPDGPDVEASAAASLISRAFGLRGPQMVLDAACASSLVALGLASLALGSGAYRHGLGRRRVLQQMQQLAAILAGAILQCDRLAAVRRRRRRPDQFRRLCGAGRQDVGQSAR